MLKTVLKFIVILFLLALLFGLFIPILLIKTVSANHLPSYEGYVNDFANVLSDDFENKLENKLFKYDQETTNQVVVVTVDSTQNDTIENYSIHLAEQWKPGQKEKDNGILMLFAMKDHKMRIEVGRGLEGELTDIESKHILDDTIRPLFRAEKVEEGVDRGVDAVMVAIATESATPTASENQDFPWIPILIGGILVIIVIAVFSKHTPLGGEGDNRIRGIWVPKNGSKWGSRSFGTINKEFTVPIIPAAWSSGGSSWGGGVSFGGGSFSGGGATSGW